MRPTKIENGGILFESVFFARLRVTLDALYFHTIRVGFFRAFTCHSGCHIFSFYSSRFFSRVYVSLWMPYIFTVLTPSWTDWLAHLTSISCDSFYRSGTAWYLFCASLGKTTNNLCFILSRGGYPFFLVDFVVSFHLSFFSRKGSDN